MQFTAVQRIFGLLLMLFSVTMMPPALVALIYEDGALNAFVQGFAWTFATGFVCWLPVMH